MADQDTARQIRDAFANAPAATDDSACATYRANAGNAQSLGDFIGSRVGPEAQAFYEALVQIAQSSCG